MIQIHMFVQCYMQLLLEIHWAHLNFYWPLERAEILSKLCQTKSVRDLKCKTSQ